MGERNQEMKQRKGAREIKRNRKHVFEGGGKCYRRVPWFGNSGCAAIRECGEIISGSQEANSRPVPGHNNSLSVVLTLPSLPTPRNTKFTQAQNVALLQIAQPNSYHCVCTAPTSIMDN